MSPVFVPVLAALVGLAIRGVVIAELLVRLRWQERQQRAHQAYLVALARTLPSGCRLDEVRADGSDLRLVITHTAEPSERASR